jgi:hypothetical protein
VVADIEYLICGRKAKIRLMMVVLPPPEGEDKTNK